jgi:hypothetical protein
MGPQEIPQEDHPVTTSLPKQLFIQTCSNYFKLKRKTFCFLGAFLWPEVVGRELEKREEGQDTPTWELLISIDENKVDIVGLQSANEHSALHAPNYQVN